MQPKTLSPHQRLITRLVSIAEIGEAAKQAVSELPLRVRDVGADSDIVQDGAEPSECCFILEGLACHYKQVLDGRRQIVSVHFAGDLPDLHSLHLRPMDHALGALTPTRVAYLGHDVLRTVTRNFPELSDVLIRYGLIEASISREWMANIGRRPARERVAHLICEIYVRMRALGLTGQGSFKLPMTQAELGDATGLSPVHVNRVLQQLRQEGFIRSRGETHTIADWERLREAGDFDCDYLHLRETDFPLTGRFEPAEGSSRSAPN